MKAGCWPRVAASHCSVSYFSLVERGLREPSLAAEIQIAR
jgi:hypothetical protein